MKKWCFIVPVKNWDSIKNDVQDKAAVVVEHLGKPLPSALFRVSVVFYQKKDRWYSISKPKQGRGTDLDNLLKLVFDGLGPIIGYNKNSKGEKKYNNVRDANIVEVYAKKVNSGSDDEFLTIEVEEIG